MAALHPPGIFGEWKYGVSYQVGDVVQYLNSDINELIWFRCILANSTETPDNATYWTPALTSYEFGDMHVAMSGDGLRVAFGSTEGNQTNNDQGAIYVFRNDAGTWTLEQRLATDNDPMDPSLVDNSRTFDTTTHVDAARDSLLNSLLSLPTLFNAPNPSQQIQKIKYKKNGGTANIGLTDDTIYWGFVGANEIFFFTSGDKPFVRGTGSWVSGSSYIQGEYVYDDTTTLLWYRCLQTHYGYESILLNNGTYWTPAAIPLTATGGETHEIIVGRNILDIHDSKGLASIRLDYTGSTLVTNRYCTPGSKATLSVFARSGTSWTKEYSTFIHAPFSSNYVDVFRRTLGTWSLETTLPDPNNEESPNPTDDDNLNSPSYTITGSLAISNDGNTIACGKAGRVAT